MVVKKVKGCNSLTNGRGPFVGTVKVKGIGTMQVFVASDKMHHFLGDAPNAVAVVKSKPAVGYFMGHNDPMQAEQLGRFIECLGEVTEKQLESVGFVEMRREVVSAVS